MLDVLMYAAQSALDFLPTKDHSFPGSILPQVRGPIVEVQPLLRQDAFSLSFRSSGSNQGSSHKEEKILNSMYGSVLKSEVFWPKQ